MQYPVLTYAMLLPSYALATRCPYCHGVWSYGTDMAYGPTRCLVYGLYSDYVRQRERRGGG
eukprot:2274841-Rhodomonas_salina.1